MNDADLLVERITEECFNGWLPPVPEIICDAVLESVPCLQGISESVLEVLDGMLYTAICARINAQNAGPLPN
jgi:hypothetical protein